MELINLYHDNLYDKFKNACKEYHFQDLKLPFDHITMHFLNFKDTLKKPLIYLIIIVARLLQEDDFSTYKSIYKIYEKTPIIIDVLKGNLQKEWVFNFYHHDYRFHGSSDLVYGLINLSSKEDLEIHQKYYEEKIYKCCMYKDFQLRCYIIIMAYKKHDIVLNCNESFLAWSSPYKTEIENQYKSITPIDFNNEKARSTIVENYFEKNTKIHLDIIKMIKEFIGAYN
jgi:hypothetical protein